MAFLFAGGSDAKDHASGDAHQQVVVVDLHPLLVTCGLAQAITMVVAHGRPALPVGVALALVPGVPRHDLVPGYDFFLEGLGITGLAVVAVLLGLGQPRTKPINYTSP